MRRLIPFFTANILFATGVGFHAFLYNFYLEGLALSPQVMGRAAATWSLGGFLALLPAGRSADRWGPKTVMVGAAVLAALGLAWGAVATNGAAIYVSSAIAGAAGVSWRVAQAPVLMQLSTTRNRSRLFTLDVAFLVGGGAAATALSGALVGSIQPGFHASRETALTVVQLIGALVTGASAIMYWLIDMPSAVVDAKDSSVAASVIPPRAILLVAVSGLWIASLSLASPFFNVYFTRTFHLPIERVSLIFSAATIATAVLLTGVGEVATRLGAPRAFAIWSALFAPAMWGLALASSVGPAAACYLIQSLVSPAANPLLDQMLLESVPTVRRGRVSSWRQATASVGQILAQSLGGTVLAAGSFAILFAVAGGLGLVAGGAVAVVAWRLERR